MKYCNRPFNFLYMTPGGDVWTCGWMHHSIGNIITQEMDDIWNSEAARQARQSVTDGSFRFCRKESCPLCENDTLPDLPEDEIDDALRATKAPVSFNIAFDYICNHSCPSCRQEIYKPSDEDKEGLDITIRKMMPYFNKAEVLSASGNGDAFASPYIMRILSELRPERPNFSLILETNGALFDEEHWNRISHLKDYCFSVVVTPNSFERDTYKYLSGGHDNRDKLVKNLHFIKKLHDEGAINRFDISIVVQDRNYRELPSFTRTCFDEFNVDSVIVKPLYQWFGMKEDVYWFKSILNPLHPYFNEYMEILKDPILDDPRVFFWGARNIREAKIHPGYQHKTNQELLIKIMHIPDIADKIKKYSVQNNIKTVAVQKPDSQKLPNDSMSRTLMELVEKAGVNAVYLQRYAAETAEYEGHKLYGFPDFKPDDADIVVIPEHYRFAKISGDIRNLNFEREIMTMEQFIDKAAEK